MLGPLITACYCTYVNWLWFISSHHIHVINVCD